MARTVYLVHGSEDGTLGIYGSALTAAKRAVDYVTTNGNAAIMEGKAVNAAEVAHWVRVTDEWTVYLEEDTEGFHVEARIEVWQLG